MEDLNVRSSCTPWRWVRTWTSPAGRGNWLIEVPDGLGLGYIFTESAAVVGRILGGALDWHSNLRVMIPHGGGMIP